MFRPRPLPALSAAVLLAFAAGAASPAASAAPCRDSKGKFITCPPPARKSACRDAAGKFTKCPAADAGTPPAGAAAARSAGH